MCFQRVNDLNIGPTSLAPSVALVRRAVDTVVGIIIMGKMFKLLVYARPTIPPRIMEAVGSYFSCINPLSDQMSFEVVNPTAQSQPDKCSQRVVSIDEKLVSESACFSRRRCRMPPLDQCHAIRTPILRESISCRCLLQRTPKTTHR